MNSLNKTIMGGFIGLITGIAFVSFATYSVIAFVQWDLTWYTNIPNWDERDRVFFAIVAFPFLIMFTVLGVINSDCKGKGIYMREGRKDD